VEIRILGAHQLESKGARLTSLLIDGTLAIDAGGITSALTTHEQQRIERVLLTHHHYDHTRDLVTLAANAAYAWQGQLVVYGLRHTLDMVNACLLDGRMYANFLEYPTIDRPTVILEAIQPHQRLTIAGYQILPVPATHSVPSLGYQVTSPHGKCLFFTGDTTTGISEQWPHVHPQLLIAELAGPNRLAQRFADHGHLCADLLEGELRRFRQLKGYLPRVIAVHIGNPYEQEIEQEVARLSHELEADISLGYEDMLITL
jgi:phosphoribosyl 1,2-cyclic phosphodiesterase